MKNEYVVKYVQGLVKSARKKFDEYINLHNSFCRVFSILGSCISNANKTSLSRRFARLKGKPPPVLLADWDENNTRKYYFNHPIYRVGLSVGQEPGIVGELFIHVSALRRARRYFQRKYFFRNGMPGVS